MKRWIFKLVVLLLLGAIVNVAVAWGACFANLYGDLSKIEPDAVRALWARYAPSHWPAPDNNYDGGERAESFWRTFLRTGPHKPVAASDTGPDAYYVHSVNVGWPLRSLEGGVAFADADSEVNRDYTTNIYIWGRLDRDEVWFPFGVIWTGFAINTIFYAAMLWLLAFGPFAARRFIREKRRRCIKCGYDLRGTSGGGGVCPECGARPTGRSRPSKPSPPGRGFG